MINMQFEIILKNEKIKSYRTIVLIVLLLNLSIFILMLFYDVYRYEAASAILLVGIYIFMRLYFIKKYQQGNYLDQVLLFVLAGCWFGLQNYYMVARTGNSWCSYIIWPCRNYRLFLQPKKL